MANEEWKVGDWCFSDFELCQIEKVDAERGVSQVSTGIINRSGWRDWRVSQ